MMSLYKTLARPHVEYCSIDPTLQKDKKIEKIQHRFTKTIKIWKVNRTWGLWTLDRRRNRQDLIELFKIFKGLSRVQIDELFMLDKNMKGTRGHCLKLRKTRCNRDITRHFFSNRVVNRWNLLDQRTVDAPSLNVFKNGLSRIRDNRMGFFMD